MRDCWTTNHSHSRVFNNEHNQHPKMSAKWTQVRSRSALHTPLVLYGFSLCDILTFSAKYVYSLLCPSHTVENISYVNICHSYFSKEYRLMEF